MTRSDWFAATATLGFLVVASGVAPTVAFGQSAVLRGRILEDSTKLPIAAATILLVRAQRSTTSDSVGQFRLSRIRPGQERVVVRRLGFTPFETDLVFTPTDSIDLDLSLRPIAQSLSEVVIPTTPIARKLVEFHARRRMGIGRFIDSVDIAKQPGTRLSDKLRELPSLVVSCDFTKCTLASSRRPPSLRAGSACPVAIGIDGVHVYGFEINDLDASAVAAVEWYAGPAQVPPQFNWARNTCGVLMIWTK